MPLRLVFMGTPDFAAATLRAVAGAGHEIAAIYTQPPRPAGRRGLELKPSPVHRLGDDLGIEVRTPKSLRGEAEQQTFAALNADAAVVVAYGLLLPEAVLKGTRLGAFNGHASLLPRWRGAAPIQRAIMAGDTETGIMVMKMDEGLDTGPVALTHRVPIDPDMTAGELHDELARSGAALMVEALALLEAGKLALTPQPPEGATYAHKIAKDETRVDWSRAADEVHNHIRGLSPFPGAWCEMEIAGRVERVKLLRSTVDTLPSAGSNGAYTEPGTVLDDELAIACGAGAVRLVELQRAGGKPLSAEDFQRGAKLAPGVVVR
ncbi:methionyl-tRNA formyltransferase [Mesorhizobium sp. Z1-4]|uniref:methionyl-tRNA formyltransferase n=1 Tax=Mesorhizobium sp. Z1-4 TaxID=2448478 RepID=UPI000FD7D87B|nr:methionyl-tRNA formyltransferase [Mesorhizobium sp. Z1-4]